MNLKRECFVKIEGKRIVEEVKMQKDVEEKLCMVIHVSNICDRLWCW